MNESRSPELCQQNPEYWHQLAIEDLGVRGNQVIVKDGLDTLKNTCPSHKRGQQGE